MDRLGHLRVLPGGMEKKLGVSRPLDRPSLGASKAGHDLTTRPKPAAPSPFISADKTKIEADGSEVHFLLQAGTEFIEFFADPDRAEWIALELANAAAQARENTERAKVPTPGEVTAGA